MKVSDVIDVLEQVAPAAWAETWDNVGLLVGDPDARVRRLLTCVDATGEVVAEALRRKAQMIVSHHPVIFKHITRLTPSSAPAAYRAARRGITIYCMHTNFDAAPHGTNDALVEAMHLSNARPLEARVEASHVKITVFLPPSDLAHVAAAAFDAGAGHIGNYYDCAFFSHGIGTFCGGPGTAPAVGQAGRHESAEEVRLEAVATRSRAAAICEAIRRVHSYETPAIDVYPLEDHLVTAGHGRVGTPGKRTSVRMLIRRVKRAVGVRKVLVAHGRGKDAERNVRTAACGAGACGDLYKAAIAAGADLYLTGEMKHNELLDAVAAGLTVVCLGHGNSERPAMDALAEHLGDVFEDIEAVCARADRDPLEVV